MPGPDDSTPADAAPVSSTASVGVQRRKLPRQAREAFDDGAREYVEGNTEAAISSLTRALELVPDLDDAHYMLSLAYLRQGNRELAVEQLNKVLESSDNAMLREYAQKKLDSIGA